MFHSIEFLKQETIAVGKLRVTFHIKDTCFSQDIEVIGPNMDLSCYEPVAIFKTYMNRSLNVVRNLAIYYLTMAEGNEYIITDALFIEKHFPTFNYRQKYHKVIRMCHDDYKLMLDEYNKEEKLFKDAMNALDGTGFQS